MVMPCLGTADGQWETTSGFSLRAIAQVATAVTTDLMITMTTIEGLLHRCRVTMHEWILPRPCILEVNNLLKDDLGLMAPT